jgi:hypothetical protein
LPNNSAPGNPLVGLTADEYKNFACALVSYVALHATFDETTSFLGLCRDYTPEIAGKVAFASTARRQLVPVLARGERHGAPTAGLRTTLKKSLSH